MKTNLFELKFYDKLTQFPKVDIRTKHLDIPNQRRANRNFYEYLIDGKFLINKIGAHYWDKNKNNFETFFDENISPLGAFDFHSDFLHINEMLLNTPTKEQIEKAILQAFPSVNDKRKTFLIEYSMDWLDIKNPSEVIFYVCSDCGDKESCGGLSGSISKNDSYYYWDFGDDKLHFKFDKTQYENTLQLFLKKSVYLY